MKEHVVTRICTFNIAAIRNLRLYHWREVLNWRKYEQSKTDPRIKLRTEKKIGFHLKQVQALNDFFPIGDTAEKDHIGMANRRVE